MNDLVLDASGNVYFTDQGQTGMPDPSGRVYRLSPDERLLFVSATRGNGVWHRPLLANGFGGKDRKTLYCTDSTHGNILMAEMQSQGVRCIAVNKPSLTFA